MPPLRPITMRGKQALAAALRAGGASSSSIRDVRDVQHPSGEVPLHIRLQEEYERVTGDRGRLQEKRVATFALGILSVKTWIAIAQGHSRRRSKRKVEPPIGERTFSTGRRWVMIHQGRRLRM